MTTTPSLTSNAICSAWSAGTSLPRRAIWRRGRRVASELSHLVGQVEFVISLPRCWQSHATTGRWFFADISRGMPLVALRQPAKWSRSQSRTYLRQLAEWFRSQSRIYLRQPGEWSWSQNHILASAYRMVQVSKPCRHIDLIIHAYTTLINTEFGSQGETHLAS